MHEARHAEGGHPHDTSQSLDNKLCDLNANGVQVAFLYWVAKHSTQPQEVRDWFGSQFDGYLTQLPFFFFNECVPRDQHTSNPSVWSVEENAPCLLVGPSVASAAAIARCGAPAVLPAAPLLSRLAWTDSSRRWLDSGPRH